MKAKEVVEAKEYPQLTKLFSIFEPPEDHTISTHAEAYRVIPKESSFQSGKWKNRPYQTLVQDAITEPNVQEVVLMTSAQSSKSEILLNTVFYYSDVEVSPILIAQPNFELCKAFSKDRLSPSIRDSERMLDIFGTQNGQGESTLLRKQGKNGAVVSFGSFNSLPSLASKSIRVVLADEIDRIEVMDSSEGNVLSILAERTSSFPNHKIIKVSTPKKKLFSHIYREYLLSDQGLLQAKCVHCESYFDLVWEAVRWELDSGVLIPESACIVCTECGSIHNEKDREELISDVQFRVRNPVSKVRGFNYNVLATINHKLTDLIEEYLEAKGDPALMEAFVTLKMGLPYEEEYSHKTASDYDHRLDDYTHDDLPEDILFITGGIDVQKTRFEIVVWGFGLSGQMYHLEYLVIPADTEVKEEWRKLYDTLSSLIYTTEAGVKVKPHCYGLDSGYQTKLAYDFCEIARNSEANLLIYPLKGGGNTTTPITPLHNRRNKGQKQFNLGTYQLKDNLYSRLSIEDKDHSGFINISKNYIDDDQIKQIHNERKDIANKNGKIVERYEVIDKNVRNEVLDCTCYSIAAESIFKPKYSHLRKVREANIKSVEDKEG